MIDLKTARYKGVEFLFSDMPTTGGNRLIKYNFPGSDKQAIERQGKLPRSFTITAVIPHENYYTARDNLIRVLEDGDKGVLTHPTFGDIENVYSGKYTLTEKLSEIGRGEIVIQFEVDDSPGIPQLSGNLAAQVEELNTQLSDQLTTDFASKFLVSLGFTGNFSDAIDNINNVADSMNEVFSFAEPLADQANDFRNSVNAFKGSIGNLIQTPADLAGEISGLFESIGQLFETPEITFGAFKSLFGFGDDDPIVKSNTLGRIQRNDNRAATRVMMKTQALGYAYLNASQSSYMTTEELDSTNEALENQYVQIRESEAITNDALEILDRLRVQGQAVLDEVRVNTKTVITVETRLIPLSVLVYSYYGSTDLVETIAELNNINQNAFVEGSIRILSE